MKKSEQRPEPIGVIVPADIVRDKVHLTLAKFPDLVSFDPTDEANERIMLRCKLDPGVSREERDGFEGMITDWHFGTYTMTDEETGELKTMPSLALLTEEGRLIRLTNSEPAVRAWLAILKELGVERVKRGLNVKICLRASSNQGRRYWQIIPY